MIDIGDLIQYKSRRMIGYVIDKKDGFLYVKFCSREDALLMCEILCGKNLLSLYNTKQSEHKSIIIFKEIPFEIFIKSHQGQFRIYKKGKSN